MPLILPPGVPLVVASPPALLAPGAPSVLPAPYVLRHPALSARALEELAEGVRREHREWDPRPWWQRPSWPDPPPIMELDSNDKVFLTDADDFSDLRADRPGINFIVIGAVQNKTVKISGAGTIDKPIVLRGASDDDSGNGAAYTVLKGCSGSIFSPSAARCILYRFDLDYCLFNIVAGTSVRVARCTIHGNPPGVSNRPLDCNPGPGDPGANVLRMDRLWYGSRPGSLAQSSFAPSGWPTKDHEVCYCHFDGIICGPLSYGGGIMCITYPNHGEQVHAYPNYSLWVHHCLVTKMDGQLKDGKGPGKTGCNLVEVKATSAVVTDNTVRFDLAGGTGVGLRFRHGLNGQMLRNLYWYEGGGRGGGDMECRDVNHFMGENASLNSSDGSVNTNSQLTLHGGNLDADRWLLDRVVGAEHNWENAKRVSVGGNAMKVVVGTFEKTYPDLPPYPTTFGADGTHIPPDGRADGNASSVLTAGWNTNTDRMPYTTLRFSLATARALRPLTAADVGVALP